MRVLSIASILLFMLAAGSGEAEQAVKSRTLYVLAENTGEAQMYAVERMSLPSSLSLFAWAAFSVHGAEVSMEASSKDAMPTHTLTTTARSGGLYVLAYRVGSAAAAGAVDPPKSTLAVTFSVKDCRDKKGGILFQPARLAVMKAVAASKKKSGFARVADLSYLGSGRFSARVELR